MYNLQELSERTALNGILSQVSTIAEKLEAPGTIPPPTAVAGVGGGNLGGVDLVAAQDALLGLLDSIYHGIIEDSRLREILTGRR